MTNRQYTEVTPNPNFSDLEQKVLEYWKDKDSFKKSVDQFQGGSKQYVFYDGPPFANGLPHYGHLLSGFVKDTYARYHTTLGEKVERRFGWDCHGLPAEMGAEKELGISGRMAIMDYGIEKFNDTCRTSVMKFTDEWEKYVTRQARWVDFKNSYKTMDISFMESVLWGFKELYKKGLVYESMRVMPYSWACETPLSNFETRLDNSYRERADKAVTVGFRLKDIPKGAPESVKEYRILAWTTTPWTLPSNLALAVSSDMSYSYVIKDEICFILASSAVKKYAKELGVAEDQVVNSFSGENLIGLSYEPLFDYFKDHPNSFRVFAADFVVEGDGTGVVHMAPGFGEDDQALCQQYKIELVCPVDNAGKFTSEVPDFEGMQVFDANDPIIIKLKEKGLWLKTEQYLHNYPHCWRTDTPLIYKAVPSWYVKVTEIKDRMVELNQQINWIPGYVKNGLFGKWLENARDWSISRNRFWGTPIPIWRSDDPKYPRIDVYGSIEELEKDFGQKIKDLHRPFIDNLVRPNPDDPTGKSMMRRVEDVFDCWFESGSMPFAQVHYPFENKEWFETHFPADFIAEYVAQTRGWFYTLMVLSTALFDRPPFLNCKCHGVVLDSTGQKLSKRLNNYADPMDLFAKYGADALRWTMLSSTIVQGQDLLIDKEGKLVFDTLRLHIKPIWNAYHFYTMYANADGIMGEVNYSSENLLDQYILSKLQIAINTIKTSMDKYDSQSAYAAISGFFEVLNNWYIRRSRVRFWESLKTPDKKSAYDTLYTCIHHMSIAMSSIVPLLSEAIYQGLQADKAYMTDDSVHLREFPAEDLISVNHALVEDMDKILDICQAGLFVRNTENIRVRQPLASINIVMKTHGNIAEFEELIRDELNVKEVIYSSNLEQHAVLKLAINFPILGKRLPHKMKDIIAANKAGEWKNDAGVITIAEEILEHEEYTLALEPLSKGGGTATVGEHGVVILDLNITNELYLEGIARDVVRMIQQARKDADFNVADRIILEHKTSGDIEKAIIAHADFIKEQTLCDFGAAFSGFIASEQIADVNIEIKIEKRS
ncbi:MAG: isoleucine-tRNA ligase [Pseudomonadota bacterium]|jgi:isoleucyl-tRNA synthetase